ncbi:DUF92 domain-containing protein [archaeon]|nr:DUF92 domain-containing protein [archaeon]
MTEAILYATYAVPVIIGVAAWLSKSLTWSGVLAGLIISYPIIYFQGIYWFAALVTFLVAGTVATRYMGSSKRRLKQAQKTRDYSNVLANGALASILASTGSLYGFLGALAAALGDTFSSEIGMLSKRSPRLITTLKRVPTGTNGGITVLGTLASAVGGLIVGMTGTLIALPSKAIIIGITAGLFGSAVDSFMGATLENRGKLKNWGTNLICTIAGAGCALALAAVL